MITSKAHITLPIYDINGDALRNNVCLHNTVIRLAELLNNNWNHSAGKMKAVIQPRSVDSLPIFSQLLHLNSHLHIKDAGYGSLTVFIFSRTRQSAPSRTNFPHSAQARDCLNALRYDKETQHSDKKKHVCIDKCMWHRAVMSLKTKKHTHFFRGFALTHLHGNTLD